VPPHVESAVLTALEKLPADRFATADAFAAALGGETASSIPIRSRSRRRCAESGRDGARHRGAGCRYRHRVGGQPHIIPAQADVERPIRFTIELDSAVLRQWSRVALSPDGHTLVYAAEGADGVRLYARRLDELIARPLAGTEARSNPSSPRTAPGSPSSATGRCARSARMAARPSWWPNCRRRGLTLRIVGPGDTLFTRPGTRSTACRPAGDPVARPGRGFRPAPLDPHILPAGGPPGHVLRQTARFFGVLDLASGRVRQLGRDTASVCGRASSTARLSRQRTGVLYRQPFRPRAAAAERASRADSGGRGAMSFATVRGNARVSRDLIRKPDSEDHRPRGARAASADPPPCLWGPFLARRANASRMSPPRRGAIAATCG
jgi:hypothetical protein